MSKIEKSEEIEVAKDTTSWDDLTFKEQLVYVMKASLDPVFFWDNRLLGNFPLWPMKREILNEFYKTDNDGRRIYNELIQYSGMRAGKSQLTALITGFETFKLLEMNDPSAHYRLPSGKEIFCINVAVSGAQALDTIFAHCKDITETSPYFMRQKFTSSTGQGMGEFRFTNNIIWRSLGSNASSLVGRTVKVAAFDELAKFIDNRGKRSSQKVYESLSKSTANFAPWNENLKVISSSPEYRGDYVDLKIKQAVEMQKIGKLKSIYIIEKPTWELNPDLTWEVLQEERDKDEDSFWRDFGGKPRSESEAFFPTKMIEVLEKKSIGQNWFSKEKVFDPLTLINIPNPPTGLILSGDPALRNDAFGISVSGYEGGVFTVYGVSNFSSPRDAQLDPLVIKDFIFHVIDRLPIAAFIVDTWYFPETQAEVAAMGIPVFNNQALLEEYQRLREHILQTSKPDMPDRIVVPYCEEFFTELRQIFIINNKRIDHPRDGSKDMVDSVANAVYAFTEPELEESQFSKGSSSSLGPLMTRF